MNRTAHYGGIGGVPPHMIRTLTRSFDTLEAAQKFAEGKRGADVTRSNGKRFAGIMTTTETRFPGMISIRRLFTKVDPDDRRRTTPLDARAKCGRKERCKGK